MGDPLGKERARRLARLQRAKVRRETGRMLLDSVPLVREGLGAGLVEEVFLCPGGHPALREEALRRGVPVTDADPDLLRRMSGVETSAGAAALARLPEPLTLDDGFADGPLMLVFLDAVADPGNLGGIVRTAAAFGAGAVLIGRDSADPTAPKALRASAGALLRLPVARCVDLGTLADALHSFTLLRATAHGGVDPERLAMGPRRLLWVGNEAHGPGPVPEGLSVTDVTIPLDRATESLNVAAAAAVLLHLMR